MYARLSRFAGLPPERIEETLEEFRIEELPKLEALYGFGGILILVDRASGKAAALSLWDTAAAMHESEHVAAGARAAAVATAQPVREPIVDSYEVVFQELRTPAPAAA
jgi:hypothetical protein